ncbi:MAG: hypothetical protein EVA44_04830 [Flavobacteriales bacterium]|jgi:hypothetical protein|nr:MAG: hypothetical protein EVA44_04830 [Flavobacteriales bacterium]|tara:strand:+ start:146 stop:1135 length:990 start_codon:yes stop_codon:yes gene_type:complete
MTNESNNNAQEEMDLILLFNKAGTLFLKIILFFFRGIKEILLVWKKLAAVIILGAVLGYIVENITEKTSSKEASILLRINFDAGNFVYDAINLINQKIETEDEQFFISDLKFNEDEVLGEISIKPIIDLKDILKDEIKANEIRTLFENLEFEDNLAMTEGFKSDYEYHILTLDISSSASSSSIKKIIDYFNTNPLFIGLKERQLQSISTTIFNNEQTIKQIDKLIEKYSSADNFEKSSSQLYIDNKTYLPNELIKTKIQLEEQNEELKGERILSTETVMAVNDTSVLIQQEGLADNKIIYYPILLVLAFIIGGIFLKLYRYLDELDGRM